MLSCRVVVCGLFVSGGHRYKGRHGGGEASEFGMRSCERVECVAGRGIRGDRYFDFAPDFRGQLTLFSMEVYRGLQEEFGVRDRDVSVFRRNVVVEGVDLNGLIGRRFCLGGVEMAGVVEASPCYWMNGAFCEGAHEALRGRGGLRVRLLSSGVLCLGGQGLEVLGEVDGGDGGASDGGSGSSG